MRRALVLILTYLGWNAAFQLIVLSLMVYFMGQSGSAFAEISATTSTNQILVIGFSSLFFLFLILQMNPIATVARSEIATGHVIETQFYPAFLRGSVFACVFAFIGIATGYYQYIGFFVQSDTPAFAAFSLLFRALSILFMIYADEFVFRGRFIDRLRDSVPPLQIVIIGTLFYTLSKGLMFHLGLAHLLTFALIGASLSLRAYYQRNFPQGAGLLAGFLIASHCAFSLPILGNETQGLLLLRYDIRLDIEAPIVRFLTGGLGGPLSSVAFQSLLLVDIVRNVYREKKSLLPLKRATLR
jgi:hypothetical protein